MEKNKITVIAIGVLLVLAAVVVVLIMTKSRTELDVDQNGNNLEDVSGDGLSSVIVNDQVPGDVAFYSNLTLPEDGFVVVRKSENNQPGKVIGVKYVEAGEGLTGNAELTEGTEEGKRYFIELYHDTNANKEFDEGVDQPVLTESGNQIRLRFKATEDLPELKG